jgi:hypothetical protein
MMRLKSYHIITQDKNNTAKIIRAKTKTAVMHKPKNPLPITRFHVHLSSPRAM